MRGRGRRLDQSKGLREVFTRARSPARVRAQIDGLIRSTSPAEAVRLLVAATRNLDSEVLGYVVFPPLRRYLRDDPELCAAFTDALRRRAGSQAFRVVLLDFLDDAARHGRAAEVTTGALLGVMLAPGQGALVRARAARSLIRHQDRRVMIAYRRLLRATDPVLVDVAAHAILERNRRWRERTSLAAIGSFLRARPREAMRRSGVLRALATMDTPKTRVALRALALEVKTPTDAIRLRNVAARSLDALSLARVNSFDPLLSQGVAASPPEQRTAVVFPEGRRFTPAQLRHELERATAASAER